MKFFTICLVVMVSFFTIHSQTNNPQTLTSSNVIPFEKVYLHLDRSLYASGDDIWFKAYLTNAVTCELTDNSNTLYVELISPSSKIIDSKVIRIEKGLGNGDFHLKDSIPSGKYQVRAYTNYMRNFGELFFFTKEIVIESSMVAKSPEQTVTRQSAEKPDIQFFPEGGALIEGVPSVVGFKALNPAGFGIGVAGKIVTSKGDTVASFSSAKFGMGSFTFTSNRKLKYFAEGKTDSGVPFRIDMPEPLKTGYALRISDNNDKTLQITIKTNPQTLLQNPSRELLIVGASHNALCLTSYIKVNAVLTSALLPKKEFPEGIASISLMDTAAVIYSERLFYIQHPSNIHIEIVSDKKSYAPKEKVNLKISARDSCNKPVAAKVSLAVVNGNHIQGNDKGSDICSYYFLESEIKGRIEQPYYYFDTLNSDRFKALDNLLLTQGWRNYLWKDVNDSVVKLDYPVEKGFSVSGRLRRSFLNKPLEGVNISMAILDSIRPIFQFCKTDSAGKFYFGQLNFSGEKRLIVSATDKENDGKGLISTDSVYWTPAPSAYKWSSNLGLNADFNNFRQEVELKHEVLKKYKLQDTVMLNTVVVKAWKPKPTIDDGHYRVYSEPDKSFTITREMWGYDNVFEYVAGRVFWPYTGSVHAGGAQLCLLEGMEVDASVLKVIPMSQIYKVEILKNGSRTAMFGSKGANGVINVLLKNGSEERDLLAPDLSSINRSFKGYYQSRKFYAPKYDVPSTELKPDLRTTIYWEPNLQTDSDGNASCSFFITGDTATVKVAVEGIAEGKMPVAGKGIYEVE